ncbi:uncharacterized protein LOC127117727 [Lathyrus oleraceus]|uniref:uncharacterized protein LOC127117727 n=1 Tax=Pisum sativum TaxID=3888 RepID=UPI0021CEB483|nr:uncharacterized protein LOC127117727 [Pisum sativum]
MGSVGSDDNQEKLSSSSLIDQHEHALIDQHEHEEQVEQLPLISTNTNGPIAAVPISSYRLANESTITNVEIGDPSWIEETQLYKGNYDDTIWKHFRKYRKNEQRWDNKFVHRTQNFSCRSLNEIRRYEKTGERPSEINKKKRQLRKVGKTTNDAEKTKRTLSEKSKREEEKMAVEKFLADAHYNLLHWFDNKQPESEDDSEATLSDTPDEFHHVKIRDKQVLGKGKDKMT